MCGCQRTKAREAVRGYPHRCAASERRSRGKGLAVVREPTGERAIKDRAAARRHMSMPWGR